MTPEEFTHQLPPFAGATVPSKPPFGFRNLSLRVFPLRASLDSLQRVCDGYLNIVPAEIGRFRAVAPYTWLALLDYGQVSEIDKESIVGWFAQTEVYFGVPVEWYRCVNGRWVFHDWAVITPFIFVDDDISVPLGRTVFGFPKILARVRAAASDWIRDSFAPVTLASIETVLFPELYKGRPLESRCLLEVERDAPMSNFRIPGDATSPIAPWVIASKLAQAVAGFGRDAMWMAQTMRISEPNPWMNPAFAIAMLNRVMPAFAPGGRGFTLNSLNLKQFRSSSDPEKISYQALTNGPMQVTAFNGVGLLGEQRIALGDLSGGYSIKLYDYESLPIATILGLEGERRPCGASVDVFTLKPVMPFWANVNVTYLKGINLAWRTDAFWRGSSGEYLSDSGTGYGPGNGDSGQGGKPRHMHVRQKSDVSPVRVRGKQGSSVKGTNSAESNWPLFNTTVTSSADEALAGPFEFKGTVIRVLPLLAFRGRLQEFVDGCLNRPLSDPESAQGYKFEVWSRCSDYGYVYLTAASLGTVTSGTNNVGDWAKYALSFLIPVRRQCKVNGEWHYDGAGVVPACLFVDTTVAAASRSEILGVPTIRAEFERPPTVWLEEGRTDLESKQTLMRVDTEVFAALYERQKAAMNPLIEISSRDFAGLGEPGSLANPAEWADILKSELASKQETKRKRHYEFRVARALAIELLGNPGVIPVGQTDNRMPVSFYTLKQFRDAADPEKACYQSLVRAPVVFDEVFDVCEIEEPLRVRIHEYPSLQLVEKLGIVAKTVYEENAGVVYGTQAIRPFYIRANVHERDGERLCWRAGTPEWSFDKPAADNMPRIDVDLQAARALDNGDPSDIKSFMRQSSSRRKTDWKNRPSMVAFIEDKLRSAKGQSERAPDVRPHAPAALKEAERRLNTATEEARHTAVEDCRSRFRELEQLEDDAAVRRATENKIVEIQAAESSGNQRGWPTEYLNRLKDWQFRQRLKDMEIRLTLKTIDPQMVIEAILSREWANCSEQARWRRGKEHLRAKLTAFGGEIPFAHLNPEFDKIDPKEALKAAGRDVADREHEFYTNFYRTQMNRAGWGKAAWDQFETHIDPIFEAMRDVTTYRVEMEHYRNILSVWSIAHLVPRRPHDAWMDKEVTRRKVQETAAKLIAVMTKIAAKHIVGEPSEDDPRVGAVKSRLDELLSLLESSGDSLDEEVKHGGGPHVDAITKAAELASQYCDAQRDALFNKLAKASQKPDFCVKRDAVSAATREWFFPMSESWDKDWYSGGNDGG